MPDTRDSLEMTDFLDFDGFYSLLEERLGTWAPKRSTVRTWAKTTVQDENPFLREHMPRAHRMVGVRRNLYRLRDCEEFAAALLRDAETRFRTNARRNAA